MIGSGIFIVAADITRQTGSAAGLLLTWIFTGILTISAALSYGELAALFPRAGGQYVYLREAYSPLWGFLYGWTLFLVIQTGTIAAVAVGFARYLGVFVGRNASAISDNFSHFWSIRSAQPLEPGLGFLHGILPTVTAASGLFGLLVAYGVAQVGSLFSADAWNNVGFTAAEVKNPK